MAEWGPYLNVRMAYAPSFAADSSRILFLMNLTGVAQAWIVDRTGGWPDPVTFHDERVTLAVCAPTGPWAIIGQDFRGNERQQLWGLNLATRQTVRLTDAKDAIHEFGGFFSDGVHFAYASNQRNGRDFDIYLGAVTGEMAPICLAEMEGSWRVVAVSPQDDALLLSHHGANTQNTLYVLGLADGKLESVSPPDQPALFQSASWTPDGRIVALSDYDAEFLRLVERDPNGQGWRVIYEESWDLDDLAVSPDGKTAIWAINRDGYSEVHLMDLVTTRHRLLESLPPGVVGGLVFSPDGLWVALHHTGPRHTYDVWVSSIEEAIARPVTRAFLGGLDRDRFIDPERVSCPTFDGRQIPAWYYRPSGARGPCPVVVAVHGGPEAQERPLFNALYQYWLAEGFAVLAPNVRGSTGYGKTYAHLDDVEKRADAIADLESIAEWLRRQPDINPDQIAIYGGSYGGFMVLSVLTRIPDAYQAGIDIVGMANLETFLERTGPWRRALREAEYGSLDRDRSLLRALSPIHQVDQIRVPLMVVHGQNDPRVPVGEAEQIVEAMRGRGLVVDYWLFEDEGHGVVQLQNRRRLYPAMMRFLSRALGMETVGAS